MMTALGSRAACSDLAGEMLASLDGELPTVAAARVAAHLARCADRRRGLDEERPVEFRRQHGTAPAPRARRAALLHALASPLAQLGTDAE